MTPAVDALILDFLEWLAPAPRPYREVMDAWRTSCPRLTVWEDCVDAGYVARSNDRSQTVRITTKGEQLLQARLGHLGRGRS
jgi:hypothetical protein